MSMCADLGPVLLKNVNLADCGGVQSCSPSRLRREKRAAERAAAENAAAEKVAAEKAATESCL